MKFLKSVIGVSLLAVNSLFGDVAEMIINEVMYKQNHTGRTNDEFIEFYVTKSGNIQNYLVTDQDGSSHHYSFPDANVSVGNYVILHIGEGNDTTTGNVDHFYKNSTNILNDGGDDIVLLKPSTTDTTIVDGVTVSAVPFDYIAYGSGSAIDSIPPTQSGSTTVSWDNGYQNELSGAVGGESISLTPNSIDSDKAGCWELTTSGNASDNGCSGYLHTRSTDAVYKQSQGENNNAMPDMYITKTSIVISDPVNDDSNPKRIPGAIVRYCFTVKNTGDGSADNATIHDTLDGDNKDKLSYIKSGKAAIVTNTNNCTESDCAGISDTSGSYDAGTKKVDIDLDTPFPKDSHQCAYIETEIN